MIDMVSTLCIAGISVCNRENIKFSLLKKKSLFKIVSSCKAVIADQNALADKDIFC